MTWCVKLAFINSPWDTLEKLKESGNDCRNKCPAVGPPLTGEPTPSSSERELPLQHLPSVTNIWHGLFCFPSPLQSPAQDTKTAAFLLLFSHSVVSDSLQPRGLQHARIFCPSPSPGACPNSCPLSQICHPTISSFFVPFSSCIQSFSASGSILMSQLSTSGSQSIGVSASVLPVYIQDWFSLGLNGLISLQPKGLQRVFSNTAVQNHQLFYIQPSLCSDWHPHMTTGKTIALT